MLNMPKKKPGSHRVSINSLAGAALAWVAAPHPVAGMDWDAAVREGLVVAPGADRRLFDGRALSSPLVGDDYSKPVCRGGSVLVKRNPAEARFSRDILIIAQ